MTSRSTCAKGEVVGLLGANGAGKTTTFYMLVGLEPTETGKIMLNGRDVTSLPVYLRARLGLGLSAAGNRRSFANSQPNRTFSPCWKR